MLRFRAAAIAPRRTVGDGRRTGDRLGPENGAVMTFNERRRAARIQAELPILLEGGPAEAGGKTLNISTSGVYFEVPHFIEPLTKVRMELLFPGTGESASEKRVGFDGIVVRTEPETPSSDVTVYRTAVFFTYLPESSLKALSSYIEKRLTSSGA